MKIHELKILEAYAVPKIKGKKLFEIRSNDRHFEVGDYVHYTVIDSTSSEVADEMNHWLYQIEYITDYAQKDGFVVFSEKPKYYL